MVINILGLVGALVCAIIAAFNGNIDATIGWAEATLLWVAIIIRESEE